MLSMIHLCLFLLSLRARADPPKDPFFTSGTEIVVRGDEILYESYLGMQSREYNIPISTASKYRIASNSKLFTTVSIFQLMERGFLNVDDDIADHLDADDLAAWGFDDSVTRFCPHLHKSDKCEVVTFRQLMAMRAGLLDCINCAYDSDMWQHAYCLPKSMKFYYTGSIASGIARFSQIPLDYAPGTAFKYSNGNFIVLSYFVEKYAKMSLRDYFTTNIFAPVGLENTSYDPLYGQLTVIPNLSGFYWDYTDVSIEAGQYDYHSYGNCGVGDVAPGWQAGSGGVVSTVADMMHWYDALFVSKTANVISQSSLDEILTPISYVEYVPGIGCEYFGLAIRFMYAKCERVDYGADESTLISTWYHGASECYTSTIMIYYDGEKSPLLSAAFRNNGIVNATAAEVTSSQSLTVGNLTTIFDENNWQVFMETKMVAYRNADYYAVKRDY